MISSHRDTSSEVREKLERAEGAREKEKGEIARRFATKSLGTDAPKCADLHPHFVGAGPLLFHIQR